MLTVYDSQGESYVLTERIGSGGEGAVFRSPHDSETVAKIYHEPISDEKAEKLRWMAANRNDQLLKVAAWITDVLRDAPDGKVVGFLMPSVEAKEIHELYSLKSRRVHFPRATWQFLIHAATNVARAFYGLHKSGHIMGDVNHGNCVVLANGTVKLIDCDSYSVSDGARRYPCEVGVATHLAPELQGKNLADVERRESHDNFGLAVIIFQLLFLGRHPFAGKYEGDEDKSLEDCIRELRFAYAPDAHLRWKIRRPPGTLALDATGARLALMFERAFLTEDRPAPREWIEALEDLAKNLKQCSLHPGHHYFNELAACPFCDIETRTGLMLFPFIGAQKDGDENFNVFTVENLIASFAAPSALPALPKNRIALPPSPGVEAEKRNNAFRLVMFAAAQFAVLIFVMAVFGIGFAVYIGIVMTAIMIVVHNQSRNISRGSLTFELESAQQDLKRLEEEWKTGGAAHYGKTLAQIRGKIADYKKIQQQSGQKMKSVRKAVFRYRRDLYLSGFKIADGKIPGIGESRLERLKLSGISTAADVNANRLRSLEAIGEATTAKLLEWRADLEKNFHFNAEEIPEAELKRFSEEFAERRRGIEREIELLLGTLRSGSLAVRQNQQRMQARFEAAAQKLQQLESDLKFVGTGAAATVVLISVAISTLAIGNALTSNAPKYPGKTVVVQETGASRTAPGSGGGIRAMPVAPSADYETDYYVYDNITDGKIAEMSYAQKRQAAATLHRQAVGLLGDGDYERAEKKLRLAVRLHDNSVMILNQLSEVLYEQKKYSESLEIALEASAVDLKDIYSQILIGKNYLKLSEFEKARAEFKDVTTKLPNSSEGFFNLGIAEKNLKNYDAAFDAFAEASRLNPNAATPYYEMAICLDELGDAAARKQYKTLREKDPELAEKMKREIGIRADFK
jgi:DNA-binding helix-hairpin-helix protein with protein kinase domain/Flp pilus assembly protein TadD